MEEQNIHTRCQEGECLPIGDLKPRQGLEENLIPTTRLVKQINYEFFSKPSAPKTTILLSSVNPWQQKRTKFTQEVTKRLLRTRKFQNCSQNTKYMQVLKNSGYNSIFRKEILKAGIAGYNKILEQDKEGTKPLYRSKDWRRSARRMAKKDKKRNWLGSYKSCIFVPPTPNSELKQLMQAKEL